MRQYQQTDSVNYLVEATYWANSSPHVETYPSVPGYDDRRTVTYTPDTAGRLGSLTSNATTYAPAASVSGIGNASHNALKTETYGNSLVHAITYNNRLQPNEIKLGTSGNPTSVLDLSYNYGTTNNNGNVQSIGYNGGGLNYTQTFGYDALNRLTTSVENSGSSWSQTNGYDRYGNRWINIGEYQNLYFSTSTNRITNSGYSYDSAGNLTNDTTHAYTFDAENKISKVDGVTAYTYDGEGQRVRKLVGENTRFVYGISGQVDAEFDGSTGNLKKEYVYGGGSMVTIAPNGKGSLGTQYTTPDNLGTPRVVTKSGGTVVSRHDYRPFAEELGAGVGGRTVGMGFGASDGVRQKFTSKERDNETGLDYFGERYYLGTQGRFITVDPLGGSMRTTNPQTFNRYSYVLNNPLRYVDPDGLEEHDAWDQLTDAQRKAIATKLELKKGETARDAFNRLVTVTGDAAATTANIESVQNFIGQAGGLRNSDTWQSITSIVKVTASTGTDVNEPVAEPERRPSSQIEIRVDNKDKFLATLKNDPINKFSINSWGDAGLKAVGASGHPFDNARAQTAYRTDPQLHYANDRSEDSNYGPNYFVVHWDPT